MSEEKKSYIILRRDGLVLHTKPITEDEAWWLEDAYSAWFLSRKSRARYLAEWGNVLDVSALARRLRAYANVNVYLLIKGLYEGPEELQTYMGRILGGRAFAGLPPKARQILDEFLGRLEDFLREPVKPKPITAPVRYFEMPARHVRPDCCASEDDRIQPKPEWLSYRIGPGSDLYGISVFESSFWLWAQPKGTRAVAIRRGAADREVINAVLDDEAVQAFLRRYDRYFRELMMEHEAELIDNGYDDVVRKVKAILTTADLLKTRRREEGVPA